MFSYVDPIFVEIYKEIYFYKLTCNKSTTFSQTFNQQYAKEKFFTQSLIIQVEQCLHSADNPAMSECVVLS